VNYFWINTGHREVMKKSEKSLAEMQKEWQGCGTVSQINMDSLLNTLGRMLTAS
jgi:hypothetical protein